MLGIVHRTYHPYWRKCDDGFVAAHPLSTSNSTLRVDDGLTRLTIRLPVTELDHLPAAGRDLGRYFQVNGEQAISSNCHIEDTEMICRATFLVSKPAVVDSGLPAAIVPHHIHTLRTEDAAFTFTALAPHQELARSPIEPAWFALLLVIPCVWIFRNLRSRRTISHPG